ncbi:MAG: M48 family metallopeptidase [Gammaproteobacteria bacterium]|nr:M48 family metallopeptidase [Gammaproteobacteria bacterium]
MHSFGLLFIAFFAVSLTIKFWLAHRHISHIQKHRAQVPDAFSEKISLDDHQKAADYTSTKIRFGRWPMLYDSLLLLAWTFGGGLELLDQNWRILELDPVYTGIAVILSLMLISSLLDLPFSIYSTFVIEERFGFNRTTARTFMTDLFKGMLLALVIGTPLIWVILWLMEKAGDLWWLYTWVVWTAFSLFIAWAYPTWIAPVFNKFTPLEEGETLNRIKNLLNRCGFNSNGIFVIDGSRRSSHGNAYFSGFGKNKRIVFFDTLLKSLDDDELEAVLAHELGHFKRKHIIKGMMLSISMSLAGLWILAWLMQHDWFYNTLGISTPSTYMALLLFTLVIPVFTFLLSPLMSMLSRKNEFEADEFAAETSSANDLIRALVNMYKENASTLTPDPVYSAFYDSHPPAPVRIAHLARQQG